MELVQRARVSNLTRTVADAVARYGANSPEAQAAQAAVAATAITAARVAMAHQQFVTTPPEVAQAGWALHGRVFDDQLNPVSGYTVYLVDAHNNYQQAYGFAFTDSSGYFVLNYSGPASAKVESSTAEAASPQLFVSVADTKAQPVHLSDTAFQPVTGNAAYEEIALAPGGKPIGDPPQAIRDVAMPKEGKPSKRRKRG
jgi:hypothetical protein